VALPGFEDVERRHVLFTGLRAIATSALVLGVYFAIPNDDHPHRAIVLRMSVGLAFFIAVLLFEVQAIIRSNRPMLRAANAMALVLPIFVVEFAWMYITLSKSNPVAFTQPLDKVGALYFTVTVFTTVGFGDIAARTHPARLAVTAQMVLDVIVIAVVIRLILEAARGTFGGAQGTMADDGG
jgi:hypothetical protein